MIIRYAVVYATLFTCYYLQFFSLAVRDSSWMYLVAVVMGIACAQVGIDSTRRHPISSSTSMFD